MVAIAAALILAIHCCSAGIWNKNWSSSLKNVYVPPKHKSRNTVGSKPFPKGRNPPFLNISVASVTIPRLTSRPQLLYFIAVIGLTIWYTIFMDIVERKQNIKCSVIGEYEVGTVCKISSSLFCVVRVNFLISYIPVHSLYRQMFPLRNSQKLDGGVLFLN